MNRLDSLADHAPLFAEARGDIQVSFEFFPPKTEKMAETLWESVKTLEPLHPRFVSVTYGAGGSTRERTHQTVERILKETSLTPAAHLTCVGASRGEIDEIAREYWNLGVRNIVALRGDAPEAGTKYQPHPEGYRDACELVAGLKTVAPFDISVAAYPEIHPDFSRPRVRPRESAGARSTRGPTGRSPNSSSPPTASSASATKRRLRASRPRSFRASCRFRTSRRPVASRPPAAQASRNGWTICSKASTTFPRRAS